LNPLLAQHETQVQQNVDASEVVIQGQVSAIRRVEKPLVASAAEPEAITEHDPDWREAIVQIGASLKGAEGSRVAIVRFPASLDVAWADYPKLRVGQSGIFFLAKDAVVRVDRDRNAPDVVVFRVKDIAVLPTAELLHVRQVIRH
jgi:hypothetical protein